MNLKCIVGLTMYSNWLWLALKLHLNSVTQALYCWALRWNPDQNEMLSIKKVVWKYILQNVGIVFKPQYFKSAYVYGRSLTTFEFQTNCHLVRCTKSPYSANWKQETRGAVSERVQEH